MAESKSSARRRADGGTPTSGVQHVRTRMTKNFTVITNDLLQRRGSAMTVGVAGYILSLPDGAPVTIKALCEHFEEGEIIIARALNELEAAGYLERRKERHEGGLIRTRTLVHDVPGQDPPEQDAPERDAPARGVRKVARTPDAPPDAPDQPQPPAPADRDADRDTGHDTGPCDAFGQRPEPPAPAPGIADADPLAVTVLASLRRRDPRLVFSEREVAGLAPSVVAWLERGVDPREVVERLTVGLPLRFTSRPSRLIAFRLLEVPAAAAEEPARPAAVPMQTCEGCDRAFRAPAPGHCHDCQAWQETG